MAPRFESKPICLGLFDSGLGGLSVLRRLSKLAAASISHRFEFIYLGDTARCPYGNRDEQELKEFIGQIVTFLGNRDVDHIIMACNTSAAVGAEHARNISPVPVHDLISATAKYVAGNFRRVGVMATQSTVNSAAFSKRIQYHAPQSQVFEVACPKLVPLVESGEIYGDEVKAVLMEYTSKLEEMDVDAVILGCTHFPFMKRAIADLLDPAVSLIDPADLLARQLTFDLGVQLHSDTHDTWSPDHAANATFYTTGSPSGFARHAAACLGPAAGLVPLSEVHLLPLETLRSAVVHQDDQAQVMPSNVVPLKPAKPMTDSKIVAP